MDGGHERQSNAEHGSDTRRDQALPRDDRRVSEFAEACSDRGHNSVRVADQLRQTRPQFAGQGEMRGNEPLRRDGRGGCCTSSGDRHN